MMFRLVRVPLLTLGCVLLVVTPWSTGAASITGQTATPIVDLGYAKYQGFVDSASNNTHFFGMRYAAPPVGPLRFRAPQPPVKVSAVQGATSHPPMCLQASQGDAPTSPFRPQKRALPDTEDCLFLDLYTPGTLGEFQDLPVVVWIHGGGYVSGSATGFNGADIQNGDDLIREGGGRVVAVVIQYRLGLFGFLPSAKVKADGALNAGLLDQQAALRWVQSHISKFGGDSDKVTIWGESAGAGSVLQHVIANDGNTQPPLFRGAITSSSFLPSQYGYDDTIPKTLYGEAISKANCTSSKDTLNCLRKVDSDVLEAINVEINDSGFFGTFVFVPVVDGSFIKQRPTQALSQGKVNGDFVYAVTNTFEGALFVNASTADTVQVQNYVEQLFPKISVAHAGVAADQYKDVGAPIDQVIGIMGEAIFICPTYYLLRAFKGNAFKGEFAIPPGGHGNDLVYYFPSTGVNGLPPYNNTDFDNAFAESFLAFVRSLDPNRNGFDPTNITPFWQRWSDSNQVEMLFNRTEAGDPVVRPTKTSNDVLKRCHFWESVSAEAAQ